MANTGIIESALLAAGGIEMVSPSKVSGLDGRRIGRRIGNALEFAEYRDYQAGDDIRRLDWGVYMRSEQLMVKQYNEEVDPRCDIIIDHSASMSCPENKAAACLGIATVLAAAAAHAGFTLAVWHAGDEWHKEPSPEMPLEWTSTEFGALASPGDTIMSFTGNMLPRGIRIVLSDFLWPASPAPFLQRLCEGARRVYLVRLDFSEEYSAADYGNLTMEDAETGEERELLLDGQSITRFRERLERHHGIWQKAADEAGAAIFDIGPEEIRVNWAIPSLSQKGIVKI